MFAKLKIHQRLALAIVAPILVLIGLAGYDLKPNGMFIPKWPAWCRWQRTALI